MKLYEIDTAIENLIDKETGEILDFEQFEQLQMDRDKKLENIALWIKNLTANADMIKAEKNALAARENVVQNKANNLKGYLSTLLNNCKFTTPKVNCSFRKSAAVELSKNFTEWAKENAEHLLRFSEPCPDKTAIKEKLILGQEITGAALVEHYNLQIK